MRLLHIHQSHRSQTLPSINQPEAIAKPNETVTLYYSFTPSRKHLDGSSTARLVISVFYSYVEDEYGEFKQQEEEQAQQQREEDQDLAERWESGGSPAVTIIADSDPEDLFPMFATTCMNRTVNLVEDSSELDLSILSGIVLALVIVNLSYFGVLEAGYDLGEFVHDMTGVGLRGHLLAPTWIISRMLRDYLHT